MTLLKPASQVRISMLLLLFWTAHLMAEPPGTPPTMQIVELPACKIVVPADYVAEVSLASGSVAWSSTIAPGNRIRLTRGPAKATEIDRLGALGTRLVSGGVSQAGPFTRTRITQYSSPGAEVRSFILLAGVDHHVMLWGDAAKYEQAIVESCSMSLEKQAGADARKADDHPP